MPQVCWCNTNSRKIIDLFLFSFPRKAHWRRGASMGKGARGRRATRECRAPHLHFVLGNGSSASGRFANNGGVRDWAASKAVEVKEGLPFMGKRWLGDFDFHRLSIGPGNAFVNIYFTALAIGRRLP
jgi:hypothetical protein